MPIANLPSSTIGPYPNPKNGHHVPHDSEDMITELNESMVTELDEQMVTETVP